MQLPVWFFCWHTQTQETKNTLGLQRVQKAKEKACQITVLCGNTRRPTDKQRLDWEAGQQLHRQSNSKNIGKSRLVTKYLLIIIQLQTAHASFAKFAYLFNIDSTTELTWVWNSQTTQAERAELVTWQSQQTTIRTRLSSRPTSGWQVKVVSACCLNVLSAVNTAWLG